jgi:hypothetical protein
VFGYRVKGSTDPLVAGQPVDAVIGQTAYSVDDVAIGVARFVVQVRDSGGSADQLPGYAQAEVTPNDETARPDFGKWILRLTVGGVGQDGVTIVDKTPLRAISVTHRSGAGKPSVTIYELGLDDLRPWRVGVLANPARVVVDVGGPTEAVTANLAVYAPTIQAAAKGYSRTVPLRGAARAFEATVPWRLKDSAGRIVAQGSVHASIGTSPVWGFFDDTLTLPNGTFTLEVLLINGKGDVTDLVSIPIVLQ